MSEGVITTGLTELRRAIEQLPAEVEAALEQVARETAARIADRARALVPVQPTPTPRRPRPGQTRESIRVVADPARHQYRIDVGPHEGLPATEDWPALLPTWLEFGTRYMTARPFMRPALDAEDEPYRRALERASAAMAEQVFR